MCPILHFTPEKNRILSRHLFPSKNERSFFKRNGIKTFNSLSFKALLDSKTTIFKINKKDEIDLFSEKYLSFHECYSQSSKFSKYSLSDLENDDDIENNYKEGKIHETSFEPIEPYKSEITSTLIMNFVPPCIKELRDIRKLMGFVNNNENYDLFDLKFENSKNYKNYYPNLNYKNVFSNYKNFIKDNFNRTFKKLK